MHADRFEQMLRGYDGSLSLRWASLERCWVVERKELITRGERQFLEHNFRQPEADKKRVEECISARAGKHIVIWTNTLDNRVLDKLKLQDVQRWGLEVVDRDVREKNRKKAEWRKRSKLLAEQAGDVVEHVVSKRSDDLNPQKTDLLIRKALGRDGFEGKAFSLPLLDAYGVSPKKEAPKLHLATR